MIKCINKAGREYTLEGAAELIHAVESGTLVADSLVFDTKAERWVRAADHSDCGLVLSRFASGNDDAARPPVGNSRSATATAPAFQIVDTTPVLRAAQVLIVGGFAAVLVAAFVMTNGLTLARLAGASLVPLGIVLLIANVVTNKGSNSRAWSYLAISIIFVGACLYEIYDLWQMNRAAEAVWEHFPHLRP